MNFELNENDNNDQSYEYRPSDAYMRKELEYKRKLLIEEFKQADLNKDQMLSEKELLQFLDLKVIMFVITLKFLL